MYEGPAFTRKLAWKDSGCWLSGARQRDSPVWLAEASSLLVLEKLYWVGDCGASHYHLHQQGVSGDCIMVKGTQDFSRSSCTHLAFALLDNTLQLQE